MAHIGSFLVEDKTNSVGLNNYIAREVSPSPAQETASETPVQDEKERHVWRMHQPSQSRKISLFPAMDGSSVTSRRTSSPDSQTGAAQQTAASLEKAQSILGTALKVKGKEQSLIRRRKVSVPELGPMTTVQEVAMDSPTIPGRPAFHERSISAPGNSWRQHAFADTMISCIGVPALDENDEFRLPDNTTQGRRIPPRRMSPSPRRQPLSPKDLAPLVIPSTSAPPPQYLNPRSNTRLRSESTPPEVPPKSARMKDTSSPFPRSSPFTPGSAYTPQSATTNVSISTLATSVGNTPTSTLDGRISPKPWISVSAGPSPMGHTRNQSESTPQKINEVLGHRRGESETSIMDRGRPKKRSNASPMKRTESKRSQSQEQKAFETLPKGHRAKDAPAAFPSAELETIRKQAIDQASRFEVLSTKDVEALSRELRGLDERCEYLRKTHRSLRSGRRNLHDRICSFLRSPRVARFSHDSILKQEEALSELDTSIDDWVSKLEQAENRRTRVRQKLLEHVAAACVMQPPVSLSTPVAALAAALAGEQTPPRSPTKVHSPVPARLAEEVKVSSPSLLASRRKSRYSVESIRIYADSDVYALLADVEEELDRMIEPLPEPVIMEKKEEQNDEVKLESAVIVEELFTLNAAVYKGLPSTVYKPAVKA